MSGSGKDENRAGRDERRADRGTEGPTFTERIPWKQAILIGVGAFVVGFLLISGLVVVEGILYDDPTDSTDDVDGDDEDEPGLLTILGWVYFSTQFVDLEVDAGLGSTSVDFFEILTEEASIPAFVWRLVPMVVLVGAGYLLASRACERGASPEAGAKMGATVTSGYLLAVIAGALLFSFTDAEEGDSIGVSFTEALLLSGLLYPALFGAIGGYLALRE